VIEHTAKLSSARCCFVCFHIGGLDVTATFGGSKERVVYICTEAKGILAPHLIDVGYLAVSAQLHTLQFLLRFLAML
jgi:hypothetical protein